MRSSPAPRLWCWTLCPQDLRPIVQVIDDWNTNRKLGLIWECRVGPGKLLVCSADLAKDLDQRPAARQLRASLLSYMAGDRFNPKVAVTKDALARLLDLTQPSKLVTLGARVIDTDSEDTANGNVAANAIDGNPDTIWHTQWTPANDPMPHHLTIDLGRAVTLNGITYLPRQDGSNGRIADCEIYCSNDPNSWTAPAAKVKWPQHRPASDRELQPTSQGPLPENRRPLRGEPQPLRQHRRAGCPHRREIINRARPCRSES